jgi:CMP-N,N'-diacetyllegionaminic acid synthase
MISGLSVLAVIPARGGSKGLPGKNILPVQGRPLIAWTVQAARDSRYIDRVIVSSDDDVIIAAAVAAGCDAPFRRTAALATDEASSADVVLDALQRIPGHDIVVLLQPTSPLREARDIDGALELLLASSAPACASVRPAEDHPYWTFRLEDDRLRRYAGDAARLPLRRQDLPPAWCLNGAVYAARTAWFASEHTFLSDRTVGFQMPAERSLDIDTAVDMDRLHELLQRRQRMPRPQQETQ